MYNLHILITVKMELFWSFFMTFDEVLCFILYYYYLLLVKVVNFLFKIDLHFFEGRQGF